MFIRLASGLSSGFLVLGCLTPSCSADAATSSASISVSATVLAYCAVTASPLAFGNYSPSVQSTASTSVVVICTTGTPYNVGLDAGVGSGASVTTREMTGTGATTLGYSLYTTSGYGTVWGNTVGSNTVLGAGTGVAQTLTVYGRIPVGENVAPGAYTDTVTVTLTY
jgi:spore coat protein U-like protein